MKHILEQALIALLNEEKGKAEELFNSFIENRSKEVTESLSAGKELSLNESIAPIEQVLEADLVDTDHPFLALHPSSDGVCIAISDCDDLDDFCVRWDQLPDAAHAEFGYDVPVCLDDNGTPIQFDDAAALATMPGASIVEMTFDEYVDLFKGGNEVKEDEESDSVPLLTVDTDDVESDDSEKTEEEPETIEDRVLNLEDELDLLSDKFDAMINGDEIPTGDEEENVEDLGESMTPVVVAKGDGRLQGDMKFSQNRTSPVVSEPADKRASKAKPVQSKSVGKTSFERETAPVVKVGKTRENSFKSASDSQKPVK